MGTRRRLSPSDAECRFTCRIPASPGKARSRDRANARSETSAKGLVINDGGEILGNGAAVAYEWEEVNSERFVKLFLSGVKQAAGTL